MEGDSMNLLHGLQQFTNNLISLVDKGYEKTIDSITEYINNKNIMEYILKKYAHLDGQLFYSTFKWHGNEEGIYSCNDLNNYIESN